MNFIRNPNSNVYKNKIDLPIILRPPNRSEIFSFKSPNLSISTRTFNKPPGPPTLVTLVV